MITKAYILKLPVEGDNIYKVNIPLMNDNVNTDTEFDALVCSESSNYNNYEVGDCVWVGFEDDLYNIAVILGKLYVEKPKTTPIGGVYNSLKVTGSAELPEDVKIGKYSAKNIFELYQKSGSGNVDESQLKKYVKWENTEEEDPTTHVVKDSYANTIKCMSGETWDYYNSEGELEEGYLYFLTSAPPSEKEV